jgi:pimeloyl-ACP methyl ester carboxylesterase
MSRESTSRAVRIAIGLVGLLFILLVAGIIEFVIMRGSTPSIRDASGRVLPDSIASLERLQVGDSAQYILIRAHDRAKPVLLFLHGGPGMPAMYLAHAFQRELERDFVVVHWDRRGAGKSYAALAPSESPTVRQTLDDTYAVTRHLRDRFKQDRIYLVGHSWGSYLGLLAAHEQPQYYHAFVGTGQVAADAERTLAVQRDFVLRSARATGDDAVVARIQGGGRPTEDDLFRYEGQLRGARSFLPLLRLGMWAPEYTLFDIPNVPRGAAHVGQRMIYDVIDGPLDLELLQFIIPIAFFLGRHDYNTPSALAAEYLRRIDAPVKRLVWFEDSAHFPFLEEAAQFHAELVRLHADLHGQVE